MRDDSRDFDVLIIGGGPGGLSAGVWCADLGLSAVVFEKEAEFGGQLLHAYNPIENYLGIAAANGRELRDLFFQTIENTNVLRLTNTTVSGVDLSKKMLELADGTSFQAKAIIIATGVRRRKLNIPGEEEFAGSGILESGAKDREQVKGKTVVIVGGGDAALENALILGETAEKVSVVHRRNQFTARREFVEAVHDAENIELFMEYRVTEIDGDHTVNAIESEHVQNKTRITLAADAVLIRIGVEPNTELFSGQIEMDDECYLIADRDCATSIKGVFAVGDAANPKSPTISTATGDGARAARAAAYYLAK